MNPRPILLYCHNVLGFGHIARSLRIAEKLLARGDVDCRLVTGCRFLDRLRLPDDLEIIRLPALRATADGGMEAVDGGLLGSAIRKRSRILVEQLRGWRPEAMLVDHNPFGLMGELLEALDAVEKEKLRTRLIWGIRDIGSPNLFKIRRDLGVYHSAIAYTDARWLDTFAAYDDVALPAKRSAVGFVAAHVAPSKPADGAPIVAVLSGGGEGADRLLELMARTGAPRIRFVAGPFASMGDGVPHNIEVWPERSVEEAIDGASLVVCRAGYNTAYAVVQSELPVVFVPLTGHAEQNARAQKLAELDGVDCVDEDAAAIGAAIERALARGRRPRSLPFSIDGAQRAAEWILNEKTAADR